MLLNGMFAFRKTIVQIKRNPDTSTESIADQQPSTYPQHLYKYVSLTTAVQISRLFDILMSHRLYFPRYTELNDPLEGAAIDIPVGGYAGSSIYKQEDREDPFIGGLKAQYRILSLSDDPCSPQLWAHYAGNYTGACLCFRTDGKFSSAKKVQYFQRKPKPKTETMENQLEPSVEDCKKMVYSNWFLKQKGWEYEREWRIVEESTSNYFDYNPGELVGIILGTNLDSHRLLPGTDARIRSWIRLEDLHFSYTGRVQSSPDPLLRNYEYHRTFEEPPESYRCVHSSAGCPV